MICSLAFPKKLSISVLAIVISILFLSVPMTFSAEIVPEYDIQSGRLESAQPQKEVSYALGGGVGLTPDYEGSDDYQAIPLLIARAAWKSGRYVEFLGNRLAINVLSHEHMSFGPIVRFQPSRDDVDEKAVDDLRKVDSSLEIGAMLGFQFAPWHTRIDIAQDVADGHDGYVATLGVGWSTNPNTALLFGLDAHVTYASEDYMNAYFDIDADNAARSGLKQYDADSGFKDVGLSCRLNYRFSQSWSLMSILGYKRLIGDAQDSPVVDKVGSANQYFGGLMVTYMF